MKKYEVKDVASGEIIDRYYAEQPRSFIAPWGSEARDEQSVDADGNLVLDASGNPVMNHIPASYEVIETDITAQFNLDQVHQKRRDEYPSLGDQLDAAFKARAGDDSALKAIDAQIAAVKAKYPKSV